ncbi:MAG: FkbM family methyltransferase [Candidatus Hatepunaea meridiana]|nr:FkbM family methyltransferase [Candidatus Hatepunaea meridiana]
MMGKRNLKQIVKAIIGRQHYIALINMVRNYPEFPSILFRYITGRGSYPYQIEIRTPAGMILPTLYSHHDLLTVNEIFCRCDYIADKNIKTVVDLGSNIGISALYWLTRNSYSKCYLYEPDERNTAKLKENLAGYEDRYILSEKAVSYESGKLEFGIESTGRYGGIGVETGSMITVDCLDINDVIAKVINKERVIDVLKIDTEGVEVKTVEAINLKLAERIKIIYLEANPNRNLHPALFWQKQYGSVCRLQNKII